MSQEENTPHEELNRIIESGARLGININQEDALQWLTAIAAREESEVTIDEKAGVFGHRVTMLDFSPAELAHFRKIAEVVGFPDEPGKVETALALSGSAAQSKIQRYPGDADYFERVNIIAPTRKEACDILADMMHEKSTTTIRSSTYQLIEVKFGNYPFPVLSEERVISKGSPISWKPGEIVNKKKDIILADGSHSEISWNQVAQDPGWCKLDWVFADNIHGQLVNASNMLDVTWEAPDGSITPLDGYLDPYFQEVYLEAESIPVFSKLSKHVSSDALDDYVLALEKEIHKYLTRDLNYGKAARRMYNVFRLTGQYEEAAFLRELFDEPATILYQVWSLIRTIDDCFHPGSSINKETMLAQCDRLILTVVSSLEGERETEIVRQLLRLRDILSREHVQEELSPSAEAARAELINIVNNFFYEKLTGHPKIKLYMEDMSKPD